MTRFREDAACKVFLSTDAGGVGLNLQSGSVVINMDIPWNPAVLEQRIGRIHRMGQKKAVRVVNFVTSDSIEERILDLLKFKKSLFAGALDPDGENVVMIGESQLGKFMKSVETMTENLALTEPGRDAETQITQTEFVKLESGPRAKRSPAAARGNGKRPETDALGALLASGARFLSDLGKAVSESNGPLQHRMSAFIGRDEQSGQSYLRLPLPSPVVLQNILSALNSFMSREEVS